RAMLRCNGRPFNKRQEIALHAFAAYIRALAFGARADLVDLIEKDDAVLLHRADRILYHLFLIEQLVALFRDQHFIAVFYRHAARPGAGTKGFAHDVAEIDHADLATLHAGNVERGHADAVVGDFNLDFLVIKFARAKFLAEALLRCLARIGTDQRFKHAVFSGEMRLGAHILAPLFAGERDRNFHEVADDLFHVAADIADFSELRRFHFQ